MANEFIREAVDQSDKDVWAQYELGQNRNNEGNVSSKLKDDSGTLKITIGKIGFNDTVNRGTMNIDTETTISMAAVTNGNWAKIEMALSSGAPVFTAADIVGANSTVLPTAFTGAWSGSQQGYYIDSAKRCVGLAWKTSGGDLDGIINTIISTEGYFGSSEDTDFSVIKDYNISTSSSPPGTVTMFAGSAAPNGWLLCNGAAINRTTYATLFAIIGTTYGVGDGSTTFNTPDTQGVFVRGAGTSTKLTDANSDAFAGVLGTYQNDKVQGHRHALPANHVFLDTSVGILTLAGAQVGTTATTATPGDPITDGANGTPRTGVETNPANLALNYIIKI